MCVVNKRNSTYGVIHNVWKITIGDWRRERWRNGECADNSDNIRSILGPFSGGGDKAVLLMYIHVHLLLGAVQIFSNFSHFLELLTCRIIV